MLDYVQFDYIELGCIHLTGSCWIVLSFSRLNWIELLWILLDLSILYSVGLDWIGFIDLSGGMEDQWKASVNLPNVGYRCVNLLFKMTQGSCYFTLI
jgi:hypothetical protein